MATLRLGTALLCLGLAACGGGSDSYEAGSAGNGGSTAQSAAPQEPLGHAGRWITDATGRVVILHGFNVVPVDEQTLPRDMGMGSDNARWLADHGFNTVRLGLYYARIEPQPGQFDEIYLEDYLRVQQELAQAGIFTLLDFHQDQLHPRYGVGGPIPSRGLPEWMLKDDGAPNPATPYPQGYLNNPALNRAYDNFWTDFPAPDGVSVQEHYAQGWQRVAAAFRDKPGLLGYDIFNEPWPGSQAGACANPAGCPPGGFDQTLLTAFTRKIVGALRAADTKHLIFYEPNLQFDYGAQTGLGDSGDDNAGFTFHDYCIRIAAGEPTPPDPLGLCGQNEAMPMDNAEAHAARTGDALLMSEIGFDDMAAARITALADAHMLSWQWWDYYGDAAAFSDAKLDALARPYPRVIAGTPQHWSFDPGSKRFEFEYTTERADGGGRFGTNAITEIFLPQRHYPNGFNASVENGTVQPSTDPRRLLVSAMPGAERVRVEIQAR